MSPYNPAQGGYLDSILPSILGTGSLGKGITAGLDAYANKGANAQPPAQPPMQGQGYADGGTTDTRSILEQQLAAVPAYGDQGRDFGREILYKKYLPETPAPTTAAPTTAPSGAGLSALAPENSALGGGGADKGRAIADSWGNKSVDEKAAFWGEPGREGWAKAHGKLAGLAGGYLQGYGQPKGITEGEVAATQGLEAAQAYGNFGKESGGIPRGGIVSPGMTGPAIDMTGTDTKEGWGKSGNADVDVGGDSDSSMGFGIEGGGYAGDRGGDADDRANGGAVGEYARGGLSTLGGYSDGGRLLRGPGDGVSDSIPATIGKKRQPARLADGEFVVPARIVSELGNGSTEAGARKLYAMLDRIQANRKKSIGKGKVAANSRSDKQLPA